MPGDYVEILDKARQEIREYAGDHPDKWWYANRYVYARLQLDERATKKKIKVELYKSNPVCAHCNVIFEALENIYYRRIDTNKGYSLENCILMHSK